MTLEQQLATLTELGFNLNEGVTVGDFIKELDREEYEQQPFDLNCSSRCCSYSETLDHFPRNAHPCNRYFDNPNIWQKTRD